VDIFVGSAKVIESVDEDKEIAVRVKVLGVKHTRCDASEAAYISESISGEEDAVIVPESEKTDNIEKSGCHVSGSKVRVDGVFVSGLVAMINN